MPPITVPTAGPIAAVATMAAEINRYSNVLDYEQQLTLDGGVLLVTLLYEQDMPDVTYIVEDVVAMAENALIQCSSYRYGRGRDGCVVRQEAPFGRVVIEARNPANVLLVRGEFTLGETRYYAGDGTAIIEARVSEVADHWFVNKDLYPGY